MVVGDGCRDEEVGKEMDVVQAAEAYFKKFEIKSLLTQILIKLGEEQPDDPAAAIRAHLEVSTLPMVGKSVPISDSVLLAADEEHDADDSLFQVDLVRVLVNEKLPDKDNDTGADLSQRAAWAGGFNRSVMENWVPQPSPCCGCASVAGAFNALWRLGRGSPNACTVREVAEIMASNCEKLKLQKQRRLERLLGASEEALEEFFLALDEDLKAKNFSWTAKGKQGVSKAVAVSTTRELLSRRHQDGLKLSSKPPQDSTVCGMKDQGATGTAEHVLEEVNIFEALHDVLCQDDKRGLLEEEAEEKAPEEEEPETAELLVVPREGPNWKKEMSELLSKRQAVFRLRAERPNTADVGTFGLRQAAEELAMMRNTDQIKTAIVLARKGSAKGISAPLTKSDTEAEIHRQWCCLKNAFSLLNSVLLFHLTNHYALVFAWREWQDEGVEKDSLCLHRQILTARRGQRPSVWIDFEEVRRILLGWTGYHLLSLQRIVRHEPRPTEARNKDCKGSQVKPVKPGDADDENSLNCPTGPQCGQDQTETTSKT